MGPEIATLTRWIESLAGKRGDIAELLVENRRETIFEWRDGELTEARVLREGGVSARLRRGKEEHLAFLSGSDEGAIRGALQAVAALSSAPPVPAIAAEEPQPDREEAASAQIERWRKRLVAMLTRHAPRHSFRWTLLEISREVVPAGIPPSAFSRRLVSLEGTFVAASRRGDESRHFAFHAPDSEGTADELKMALAATAMPHERAVPFADGETDLALASGSAAVLLHEILSHPLEAGTAASPLSSLLQARVAVAELEVRDDPTRLDLFGGYEWDDEGVKPRSVRLLDAGRISGKLTDRAHGGQGGSTGHGRRARPSDPPLPRGSNLLVAGGNAASDEIVRRLGNGLWIEELEAGSVELVSGQFCLRFPRARRVRRGRMADEVGPGFVAGEILPALRNIEAGLGRDVRPCRSLGWCTREGQVVPVQGAAPDLIVRRLAVRCSL